MGDDGEKAKVDGTTDGVDAPDAALHDDLGPAEDDLPLPEIAPSAVRAATSPPQPLELPAEPPESASPETVSDPVPEADLETGSEMGSDTGSDMGAGTRSGTAADAPAPAADTPPSGGGDDVDDVTAGEPIASVDASDASDASEAEEGAAADQNDGVPAVRDDEDDEDDEDVLAWRAVPLTTRLEALLFAATSPLSARKLQRLAGDVELADVRDALASLSAHYEASSRAFGLEEIGGGYQLRTHAELSGLLARLGRKRSEEKLTPAALETLAIVAYRQPVLRVDVEKIRGVASGEVLRTLVEKGMVRVAGRADLPGSPLLYGTTPGFLELFGLRDLRDLPTDRELLRSS